MTQQRFSRSLPILLVALTLLVAACSSSKTSSPTTTTTTTAPSTTTGPTTSTTAPTTTTINPGGGHLRNIYLIRGGKVVVVGRNAVGPDVPEVAIHILLGGPQGSIERGLGDSTAIPDGTTINSITSTNGVATVDLSANFTAPASKLVMQERFAQIVYTLTGFPNIDSVRFLVNGTPIAVVGSAGKLIGNVGRVAFDTVTPHILVESPTPGATIHSPVTVTGTAATFEQAVNYTILGPDGQTIASGVTTAGPVGATGEQGAFSFTAAYTLGQSGLGRIVVYQVSAKDGSDVDVVQIPVQIQP